MLREINLQLIHARSYSKINILKEVKNYLEIRAHSGAYIEKFCKEPSGVARQFILNFTLG